MSASMAYLFSTYQLYLRISNTLEGLSQLDELTSHKFEGLGY
jgi:hypothetical protein